MVATKMLTLYYAPGACSISPHIALLEAALPFTLERVDFKAGKKLADGRPFVAINPKGYVPALGLADGQLLTEGVAIVQYIADLNPEAGLAPPPGTFERVRLQEWLNFISTELHKGLSPLFSPQASEEFKEAVKDRMAIRLGFVAKSLVGKEFLLGDRFSVADGYALYVLRTWKRFAHGDLPDGLADYHARIEERPAVRAALDAENLS
jgi:glutathione S-transferase